MFLSLSKQSQITVQTSQEIGKTQKVFKMKIKILPVVQDNIK